MVLFQYFLCNFFRGKIRARLGTKTSELEKTDLEFGANGPENPRERNSNSSVKAEETLVTRTGIKTENDVMTNICDVHFALRLRLVTQS